MASPRVRFSEKNTAAKEITALLPGAKPKSPLRSSYGATLSVLRAPPPPPVPPPAKISRSKSVPNIATMAEQRISYRESHLRNNGRFHHHHMIRLYRQRARGVPHVLDDSPDIYRPDWPEHQSRNQKALIAGLVLFIVGVVLSQKGPNDISKIFGWIFAVLSGWGSCYCCNEGFCRNRPRGRPQFFRDVAGDADVIVNIDPPPVQQSSGPTNAAAMPPVIVTSPSAPKH